MPRLTELETIGFSVFDSFNYPLEGDPAQFDPTIARGLYQERVDKWLFAEQDWRVAP